MHAVDTNVRVRCLINDDATQSTRARRFVDAHDVLVSITVLLETEWVLRSVFRLSPELIAQALRQFIGLPTARLGHPGQVAAALDRFEAGMDFADALHIATTQDYSEVATFDAAMTRTAGRLGRTGVGEPRWALGPRHDDPRPSARPQHPEFYARRCHCGSQREHSFSSTGSVAGRMMWVFETQRWPEKIVPSLTVTFSGFDGTYAHDDPRRKPTSITMRFHGGFGRFALDGFGHQNPIVGLEMILEYSENLKKAVFAVEWGGAGSDASFTCEPFSVVAVKPMPPSHDL